MDYFRLLVQIKKDHKLLMQKAHDRLTVADCFTSYVFEFRNHTYEIEINLLTLDFRPKTRMPVSLRSKIKSKMIEEEYLKWKFKKEGRAFFDFLKLNYDNYDAIVFTDCESPDFIIHNHKHHGYEVTEATDMHNAKFNEAVYLLTGMEHTTKEFKAYIRQIEKTIQNKRVQRPREKEAHEALHTRIVECIRKKAIKYYEYETDLDTRNVIVFNNRIGFRRLEDFKEIGHMIARDPIINKSLLDRIFIISGTHDVMVEYNSQGKIEKIVRKTSSS